MRFAFFENESKSKPNLNFKDIYSPAPGVGGLSVRLLNQKNPLILSKKNLLRYFHTLRRLRPIQIAYQLKYLLRRKIGVKNRLGTETLPGGKLPVLQLKDFPAAPASYLGDNQFSFLNLSQKFDTAVDWNFADYGKLWTYNLNYFEFLLQSDFDPAVGRDLIKKYIAAGDNLRDGLEPFPLALRTIFWIKFLAKHKIRDPEIDLFLYRQVQLLRRNLEYHLLGNHLLENAFALFFAAYYFADKKLFAQANKLLRKQLAEQILPDGAHFELTPMYHGLMLSRLLDCVNLTNNNGAVFADEPTAYLSAYAEKMLGWLRQMTTPDGEYARFGDTAPDIAPLPAVLLNYARDLGLGAQNVPLRESGYRRRQTDTYTVFVDTGEVGAAYIPGHAHADCLHFILYGGGQPILVDTGITIYEKNARRNYERSTAAHNTVEINGENQSDVWGGFRVGRRAHIVDFSETENEIQATHDGYRHRDILHTRRFTFTENTVTLTDTLNRAIRAKARFHFSPKLIVKQEKNRLYGDFGSIEFVGAAAVTLTEYDFAEGFNRTQKATVAVVDFSQKLTTKIVESFHRLGV